MSTKELVLETIKKMPEEVSFEELIDELIFIKKVQNGLEQSGKNETLSTESAKQKLEIWLK